MQGLLITLTTAATAVYTGGKGPLHIYVRSRGTGTAYLGGSDVTTVGFPLTTADDGIQLVLHAGESLYGTSTGAAVLQTLRYNATT